MAKLVDASLENESRYAKDEIPVPGVEEVGKDERRDGLAGVDVEKTRLSNPGRGSEGGSWASFEAEAGRGVAFGTQVALRVGDIKEKTPENRSRPRRAKAEKLESPTTEDGVAGSKDEEREE